MAQLKEKHNFGISASFVEFFDTNGRLFGVLFPQLPLTAVYCGGVVRRRARGGDPAQNPVSDSPIGGSPCRNASRRPIPCSRSMASIGVLSSNTARRWQPLWASK